MKRVVIHNHFARDDAALHDLHQRYLKARANRLLFENAAHRGGEDPNQVLKSREQANKYRVEEMELLNQYNKATGKDIS